MNTKIPLKQLAERVAQTSGVDVEQSSAFIKNVFSLISQSLIQGQTAEIDGIGKFTPTHNADEPLQFTPDREFAEELNAPFAIFESAEIASDFPVEQLDTILTPELPSLPPELSNESESSPIHDATVTTTLPEEDVDPARILEVEIPIAEVSTDPTEPELEEFTPVPIALHDTVAETCVNPTDPLPAEPVEEVVLENNPEQSGTPAETTPIIECGESNVEEISQTNLIHETEEPPTEIKQYIPEEDEEFVEYHTPKSRFGIGFFIGLVTGIVISALALAGYLLFIVNGNIEAIQNLIR